MNQTMTWRSLIGVSLVVLAGGIATSPRAHAVQQTDGTALGANTSTDQTTGPVTDDSMDPSTEEDSATASSLAMPSSQGLNAADKQTLLDTHNAWRAKYNVRPLVWDDGVAAVAQEWADQIATSGKFAHRQGNRYGENLWGGTTGAFPIASVVESWGSEVSYYNLASNTCTAPANQSCGHFTQVVWWNTTKLGCGKATGANGNDTVVCNYDPPGNVGGESPLGR